jgi:hypothetical protein
MELISYHKLISHKDYLSLKSLTFLADKVYSYTVPYLYYKIGIEQRRLASPCAKMRHIYHRHIGVNCQVVQKKYKSLVDSYNKVCLIASISSALQLEWSTFLLHGLLGF